NYQNTLDRVEESGALVYPIKYDTEDYPQGGILNNPGGGNWPFPIPPPTPRGRRRWPFSPFSNSLFPQWPQGRVPSSGGSSNGESRRAARYLQELADRSGGRLYDANTLYNVSQAFEMIAEELRHQYALSYYPTNAKKDGTYRHVKVRVEKTSMIV